MIIDYRNELKRLGIGVAITTPLIAAYFLLDFLAARAPIVPRAANPASARPIFFLAMMSSP